MNLLHALAANNILSAGTPLQGTLVGIHVWESGGGEDSPTVFNFTWAVEAGGTLYGVYQRLNPVDHVRIGMPVDLRVDKQKAVIDWGTERGEAWKPFKKVPERGIRDDFKGTNPRGARDVWSPATVTLEGTRERKALFGLISATDVAATVRMGDEAWPLDVRKRRAPFYAAHLWAEGIPIPAWVNPKNRNAVFIDWIAAALATPGIGEPPARTTITTEKLAFADKLTPEGMTKPVAELAAPGERPLDKKGNVSWETFLEISQGIVRDQIPESEIGAFAERFGVPAGTWPTVQLGWLKKMSWNPKLGFQYGQALAAVTPADWKPPTA